MSEGQISVAFTCQADQYGAIRYCGIVSLPRIIVSLKLDDSRIDGRDRGKVGCNFGFLKDLFEMRSPKLTSAR